MRKSYLHFLICTVLSYTVSAQQVITPMPDSDTTQLRLEQVFKQRYEMDRKLAEQLAAEKHISLRKVGKNGAVMEFEAFAPNGNMLFRTTYNVGAGRTTSTNRVWPGGSLGLSLTGILTGNRLGIWDGGATLTTHQEFGGRATQVDAPFDESDHATHVAGTMVAGGTVTNARGMAYQATIRCYDWNNDESEMASAGSGGMLVSNHSYGTITGWYNDGTDDIWYGDPSISASEDYNFGYYNNQARDWDQIAFNNPFYLICKAAGNDRGDNRSSGTWYYSNGTIGTGTAPPQDGGAQGYDCISTYGNAKNILTVGAVRKINNSNTNNGWTNVNDVVMSDFSGWGPTDDGRIKPDVVGCGVNIYSPISTSTTSYDIYSGTSMATPNVSGSLILVQQHFNTLKNRFMRASTLKALAIHTADEAGTTGPDYRFGWGLLNTAKAVQLITDSNQNSIQERTLSNATSFSQNIVAAGGSNPLRITICWTDRPGTPVAPALDAPTLMLVNDLDIRLTRLSDNVVFQPYILDPANPASAATTGDNFRDNVEQIFLAAPAAGNYRITVTHKGTLQSGAAQNFSMIISGLVSVPSASFNVTNANPCTNQTVTFTDASSGGVSGRIWYFPGGNPATSTAATVVVTYPVAGNYPVALKVTNAISADSVFIPNYMTVGGLTLPFIETFEENSPTVSRWTVNNPNNDTTWRLATIGGTSPGNRAYCMPFYNYSNTGRLDQLSSPPISLRSFSAPVLTFKHAYAAYPNNLFDSLRVLISTNCGSTWIRLGGFGGNSFRTAANNENEFSPIADTQWCATNCISIPLTAYAGMSNIRIRFESFNNYGNNLYIDNISITGTALAPVAGFRVSKTNACTFESIQFTDTSRHFPNSWVWTVTGPQNFSVQTQNPNLSFTLPGTYTVKLRVANTTGADSITYTNYITINQGPGRPNIVASSPIICGSDSVEFRTDSPGVEYTWTRNHIAINGATQASYFVKTTGTYRVRVRDANGCLLQSDSISIQSFERPAKPTVSSNLSGTNLCEGGTATLTSSSIVMNEWYRNGILIPGAISRQLSVQDSGAYTVQLDTNGCKSDMSDPRLIQVLPKPLTSEISGMASVSPNSQHTYSVTAVPGSIYNWGVTGGVPSGSGNSRIITWGTGPSGTVTVRETGSNGCSGDLKTLPVTISATSVASVNQQNNWASIYPNPAIGHVSVKWKTSQSGETWIRVIDVLGKVVIEKKYETISGENKQDLPLINCKSGVYFIVIIHDNQKYIERLVVD